WLNVGWTVLAREDQARNEGRVATPVETDPDAAYSKAIDVYDHGCGNLRNKALALGEWSDVALRRGDVATARARLELARKVVATPDSMLRFDLLERDGQVALAAKDGDAALAAYDRLRALGAAAGWISMEWRAAWGRAESLRLLGKPADALSASIEGEALVERDLRWIPAGEGRTSFLDARSSTARQQVELLLAAGRDADALAVARRARARSMRTLERADRIATLTTAERAIWDEAISARWRVRDAMDVEARDDWQRAAMDLGQALSTRRTREAAADDALDAATAGLAKLTLGAGADAYPMPPVGVVELLYVPTRDGWIGFASSHGSLETRRLGPIDATAPAATLATQLLVPFADRINDAARLWILPMGPLRAVDFHALPWSGAPLLAKTIVEYPLDVSDVRASEDAALGPALIVGDANDDLPAARVEATDVADKLARSPAAHVERLIGSQATRRAVEAGLVSADLFHYAGHGIFSGADGWQSALTLADATALSVGDILALTRVPRWVVLSGCETARSEAHATADGLGLAQAFVLAGARGVVASTRPVDDRLAADVMRALYADLTRDHDRAPDLGAALRRVVLEIASRTPDRDVGAFRVLRR
ncbi:MAG: CHAT domain-containing protein, partial [Polyangiales bacterium]